MFKHEKKLNLLFFNWLTLSLIIVFIIIIVGGLTRLTDSGLSITKWELFSGVLPPLNSETWNRYFELYKEIPQYKILNYDMNLHQFKIIFYWEYAHRLLGRFLGLFFFLPLLYFYLKGSIKQDYMKSCYLIFLLILVQGFIGWYMVKSGLVNDVTVSHYRLSLHLVNALIIISIIFWLILNLKENTYKKFFNFTKENIPFLFLMMIIFLQIILGAFVSGLNAGKIYQTWPLMGYSYFPNDLKIESFSNLFDFNNHSLVQFYHRNLAYFITAYLLLFSIKIFTKYKKDLYKPLLILLFILTLQIFIGVLTLISDLNIYLASAHQISGVLLVFSAINLYFNYIK